MMAEDPFAVLGLGPDATAEAVRQAYFRLVRLNTSEAHREEFKRIRTAYDTFRSPLRRMELALLSFDESAAVLDLEVIAAATAVTPDFDAAAALLAIELSASDLHRTAFPEDLPPIREDELFRGTSTL